MQSLFARTSLLITLMLTACTSTVVGSGDGTSSGGGGGGGSPTGVASTTSSDPCRPAPGIYDVHYTKEAGSSAQCGPIADDTTVVSDTQTDGGSGSFLKRAQESGCTVTPNSAACRYAIHCDQTLAGSHVISDSTLDTSTSTPTGENTSTASGVICRYSIVWIRR